MIAWNGSRLVFTDQFRSNSVDQFLASIDESISNGQRALTFDFSSISAARPDSMVPLISTVDWLRETGHDVAAVLPRDPILRRLFMETSWAHCLEPAKYESPAGDPEGFRVRRFRTSTEQQATVNEFMKLVVGRLQPSREVVSGLEWSINEITDNVLTHSNSATGGLVQILSLPDPGGIVFCVADSGRGILDSLREGHPHISKEEQAIAEAVKQGVTRDPRIGQGNGLAGTLRIATMSGGKFSVASERGRFSVLTEGEDILSRGAPFHGTLVTAEIHMDSALRVESALGISMNILDYYDEEGNFMILRLEKEVAGIGVGSRPAGTYVREKCRHMLNEDAAKVLMVDWTNVSLVSSSFADEAFAKLFVELGPLTFGARVRHREISPMNAGLLNKAILQRAASAALTFQG